MFQLVASCVLADGVSSTKTPSGEFPELGPKVETLHRHLTLCFRRDSKPRWPYSFEAITFERHVSTEKAEPECRCENQEYFRTLK